MGKTAEESLLMISELYPSIRVDKYVVMPNHIHVILDNYGKNNIEVVIGQFKMSVTKRIRRKKPDFQVWQRSFYDHVIRNQASYEKIWMYIENNPKKWEEDCFYIPMEKEEG